MLGSARARLAALNTSVRFNSTMAPTPKHFDYLVIGGGSGGVSSARRAASYGAKVLVIEGARMGGTCVNVGCVPKKVMWNASDIATKLHQGREYGFNAPEEVKFNWKEFKAKRDAYVKRLNGIYERNLTNEGAEYVYGWADFVDEKTVEVKLRSGETERYTADHIAITVGGKPIRPKTPAGADKIGIDSDGFFELEEQPKRVALVGAGYISVEFAGMFNALGTETHLLIRQDSFLRKFDDAISSTLYEIYEKHGVNIHQQANVSHVERLDSGEIKLVFSSKAGDKELIVDEVVWATGREPLSYTLDLKKVGIKTDQRGKIVVDEYQNTSVKGIYALGDDSEAVELTPAAIAAGRKLGDRLFGGQKDAKLDYNNIPSAVFSHPEAASIGISEAKAREQYGDEVKIYQSRFINMYYSPLPQEMKDPSVYKLVCVGKEEKVVGIHLVGDNAGEILQGFGVAVKMGATKKDLDSCVAIHPTAAEELVTLK